MSSELQDDFEKLIGEVSGKRILDVGCDNGTTAIQFAQRGATVIAVDPSPDAVETARKAAATADVRMEIRAGDLADLAFLRADSMDLAYSDGALVAIGDIDRVFRQVHRVLKASAPFVIALPHPFGACVAIDPEPPGALPLARPYLARAYGDSDQAGVASSRTIAEVFAAFGRAGLRVDAIVEPLPEPDGRPAVPRTILWRARKEG